MAQTDHVFEQILNCSSKELTKARKILQDIHSRNIPKFLGEIRPKGAIKDWEKLISDWKERLAQHLPPGDFEVLVTMMDYGMKNKDPVEHMYFYSKFEPNEAKKITEDQATRMRTTSFSEKLIRVYYNKTDAKGGYITAKENLEKWWKLFTESWGEGASAQQTSTAE